MFSPALGTNTPHIRVVFVASLGIMRPMHEAHGSPPSSAHVMNDLLTYLLTPWSRVFLEKLTGLQLVKKFPAFHETRRFITVLTSVSHLSLSWANPIQSTYPHSTSWTSILILSTHLSLGLPSGLFPSGFPTKTLHAPLDWTYYFRFLTPSWHIQGQHYFTLLNELFFLVINFPRSFPVKMSINLLSVFTEWNDILSKGKWSRYRPDMAQRVGKGIALLFHDCGTRRGEWSAACPGRTLPPGKTSTPILQDFHS